MHLDGNVRQSKRLHQGDMSLLLTLSTSTANFNLFHLQLLTSLLNAHVITTLEHSGGV